MLYVVMGLIILIAILLVLVILLQEPKGGLSRQFGGSGAAQTTTGVRSTTDMLERITWGLAAAMLVLILGLSKMTGNTVPESPALEDIEAAPVEQPVAPQE